MAYELPQLAYAYDALVPHIDAKTMEIHHSKHHQAYVTNLNSALASAGIAGAGCECELISDLSKIPASIRGAVRNNGGGHANHSLFWRSIAPGKGGVPSGRLAADITAAFGGFAPFKEAFAKAAVARFGSGWAWLVVGADKKLSVGSTANQDSPLMGRAVAGIEGDPILGLDVWEHAYYLNYQNRRPDYIAAFWNIIDWDAVAARHEEALA
jgi:Fe-Mn family superoxide dismutase